MKKFLSVLLATAVLAGALTGCSSGDKGEAKGKTLLIGGSGPLTGDNASYGISVKQGAQLAAKEINAAGGVNGYNFEVRMEDDQADTQQAVQAYSSLMDAGMNVSLGGVTSGACIAITEEVKKDGILMLTPSGSQKECTQYDSCFRVCFTDPDQGVYAADFIAKNAISKSGKVAIIYDKSNDYSAGITETFVEQAGKCGLEVVEKQAYTDQSNTDFSVQLQAVKASGADLLFLPVYAQQAAYVLTQAQSMDLKVAFFGCDGLDGIIEKIGADNVKATEGVMLLTPFAADSKDPKTAAFTAAYKAEYNAVPDQFAADGYDAVYAISEAFKAAGVEPTAADFNEKMVAAMTTFTLEGVTGTMKWTADGEPAKTATAVTIKDGAYVAFENQK
ncbi:MAG: ABC transporter substrate-binding protein [Oscillospiraceae bacterium]